MRVRTPKRLRHVWSPPVVDGVLLAATAAGGVAVVQSGWIAGATVFVAVLQVRRGSGAQPPS